VCNQHCIVLTFESLSEVVATGKFRMLINNLREAEVKVFES
jgi:hypothetical protein